MIEIEIIDSPYKDLCGIHRWYKNQLYFGGTNGDVILFNQDISMNCFMLEVIENEIYVHPTDALVYFLYQGKRATKSRKINLLDKITVGTTVFRITAAKEEIIYEKNEILQTCLEKLQSSQSPALKIIRELNNAS